MDIGGGCSRGKSESGIRWVSSDPLVYDPQRTRPDDREPLFHGEGFVTY